MDVLPTKFSQLYHACQLSNDFSAFGIYIGNLGIRTHGLKIEYSCRKLVDTIYVGKKELYYTFTEEGSTVILKHISRLCPELALNLSVSQSKDGSK